jgi:predicted nucleic acid-binding protein
VLVDSSVWIAFLRGDPSPEVELLSQTLKKGAGVWLVPIILQEVLQGADRPQRFERWDRTLSPLPMLMPVDARESARSAARLYAACRWKGFSIRSANDCLIATQAIESNMPLLHQDRDFLQISKIAPRLRLVTA